MPFEIPVIFLKVLHFDPIVNKKRLQIMLSKLRKIPFKLKFEQYPTPPDIASEILWRAYLLKDVEGKVIADLGTGNGIFAIGAKILGADIVYAVDIDEEAIEIARRNAEDFGLEIVFLCMDVEEFDEKVDTVFMNPPFGLKLKGADRKFLRKAFEVSEIVYCIHKIESDKFFRKFSRDFGFDCSLLFEFNYKIPVIYEFHEKRFHIFRAGVWRFSKHHP